MSKNKEDLDAMTFQPFGEETLMENEEELKNILAKQEKVKIKKNQKKAPKPTFKEILQKNSKVIGVLLGLFIAVAFIAYDMVSNLG